MKSKFNPKVHNRFDVYKTDVLTNKKEKVAYAENILLDTFFSGNVFPGRWDGIYYGRGTGTLDPARTTLFDPIAYKTAGSIVHTEDFDSGVFSRRAQIVLGTTEANGETIREVGIALGSTLKSHAMLRDMNGNPVAISKNELEVITIYATVYVVFDLYALAEMGVYASCHYVPETVGCGILSILTGGNLYVTVNRIRMYDYCPDGDLNMTYSAAKPVTPVMSNKTLTFTHTRLDVASFNFSQGIWSLHAAPGSSSNCRGGYSLRIARNSSAPKHFITEQIGVGDGETVDFKTKYPFVETGAIVKIDGVAESGVTIDYLALLNNSDIQKAQSAIYNGSASENSSYNVIGTSSGGLNRFTNFVWENIAYDTAGLYSFIVGSYTKVYCSADAESWTLIQETTTVETNTITIPAEHRNKRFWRLLSTNAATKCKLYSFVTTDVDDTGNVHFNTAPALGSVITIEYETTVIPKDSDHVLDFVHSISFGEYVEEY